MLRTSVRRFTSSARQLAAATQTAAQMEAPNAYGIRVSKAQGVVKGLVGGELRQFPSTSIPMVGEAKTDSL